MAARKKKTPVNRVTIPKKDDLAIKESREKLTKVVSPINKLAEAIKKGKVTIDTVEEYSMLMPMLNAVCEIREEIKAERDIFYKPARQLADKLYARFKDMDRAPAKVERFLRDSGGAFASKRYREFFEDHMSRAALAREAGNEDLADQITAMLEVQSCVPEISGIGFQHRAGFSVEDESKLTREFLCPDEKKIGAMVKSLGTAAEDFFEGAIKVQKRTVVTRRRKK